MQSFEERIANLSDAQRELLKQKMKDMSNNKSEILLCLQEGDPTKRRPIFFTHPPLGISGYFINIVRHLNPEQPAYGIQCPALLKIREPFNSYEEMASYYLDVIRTVQPEPPYILAGHSSGAFTVYEMAMQLSNHVKDIPFILLIDAYAPVGEINPILETYDTPDLLENDEVLFVTTWMVSLAHDLELPFSVEDLKLCSTVEEKYDLVSAFLTEAGFLSVNADNEMVKILLKMIANHIMVDKNYFAKYENGVDAKYEGKTVLFRRTLETRWPGFDIISPPDLSDFSGWEKFCSGPIDVLDIPETDHITIIMEPSVQTIAKHLQTYIDEVALIT